MKTTLNQIRKYSPCIDGYKKLLKFLGKTEADIEPLDLSVILESNGLDDTVWCFRAVSGFEKEKRMFAVFCVRQVQHLLTDPEIINCIDVTKRYANGNATDQELTAARDSAVNVANDAYSDASFYAANAVANAADPDSANAAYDAAYAAARAAAAYDAVYTTANAAYDSAYAYSDASEMQSVLEAYLKELLSVK